MSFDAQVDGRSLKKRKRTNPEAGPFVLRTLLQDVPLSADGAQDHDIKINCVDYLDSNLYVGTSASELLHFVQIPSDPTDNSGASVFILASRLKPAYSEPPGTANTLKPGVQQILLLPGVGKACILCNCTVTFYSLPELSPVFGTVQVKNCNWIGGIDLNELNAGNNGHETILLSLNRRIQVVRIGEDARVIKKIDFPGSTLSVRRESIACVADSRSYALVEIDRQLKIPLMSISSLDGAEPGNTVGQAQDISVNQGGGIMRSASSAQDRPHHENQDAQAHRRGASLGNLISGATRRQEQGGADQDDPVFQEATPPESVASPRPPERGSTPQLTATEENGESQVSRPGGTVRQKHVFLKPHIVSPSPEEFLLVTGTGPLEPGIGMFVNLDGDPTRPTIEFHRYPKEIAVDGGPPDLSSSMPNLGEEEEGYVLASMGREFETGVRNGLEIQRWDTDGGSEATKYWLEPPVTAPCAATPVHVGVRSLLGVDRSHFQEIVEKLCQKRFVPFSSNHMETSTRSLRSMDSRTALSVERVSKERELFDRDNDSPEDDLPEGWENSRVAEEEEFARRLAGTTARLAVWSGDHIWWALRNPLILQLDAQLETAMAADDRTAAGRRELFAVLNSFRGRDAKSELQFLTFNYIRQRAGIFLLTSFLQSEKEAFSEPELRALEEVLVESLLDPRVVLSLIPAIRNEVIETRKGIWIFGGVKTTAENYIASDAFEKGRLSVNELPPLVLQFLKRFLTSWRKKKGFGSIADENEVFRTVDAALLAILLELDKYSPPGLAKGRSIRSELYELVDNGVDCFERAETLIESYHRLFVLSRLYQSRKMAAEVLETWRRIIEGERDDGGELRDGEQRVREYLMKISNQGLMQEYGIWLANRNPKLGVQVFAEDKGRAPKFEPTRVVELLRHEAPDAVKYYLEHLVFGKGHTIYVNELIFYYLDIVITYLQSSPEAREAFTSTYAQYRALRPLKPTYRQFITDNAPTDDEVWQSRLRLLQLLGGQYDYDSVAIRDRISDLSATAEDLLVPETIILDGRQRRHEDALRLLVHRLGDYDTAVAYCIRGGASIYSIYQAPPPAPSPEQPSSRSGPSSSKAPKRRDSAPPTQDQQARLFRALLREFLVIQDVSDRVEQTGMLLERFGGWYDVDEVIAMIPDSWSVDLVAGFLIRALRRMVVEKNETTVARHLSSSQLLRVQHELVVKIEERGPMFEAE